MEKIAGEMSGLLHETMGLYQELKTIIMAEKEFITAMDVENLWSSTEKKKDLILSIESKSQKILDQVKNYVSHLEMDTRSFRIREVVSALPLGVKMKARLKSIGMKIDALKEEIGLMANENKRYILEYLSVIDGIFATIRQQPAWDQYSQAGRILAPTEIRRLIHTEV